MKSVEVGGALSASSQTLSSERPTELAAEELVEVREEAEGTESAQSSFAFPWPDGAEGDPLLASQILRLMRVEECAALEAASVFARKPPEGGPRAEEKAFSPQPRLPFLFIDTSPWMRGRRQCAPLAVPWKSGPEDASGCCSELVLTDLLKGEERVGSSLRNPLYATLAVLRSLSRGWFE